MRSTAFFVRPAVGAALVALGVHALLAQSTATAEQGAAAPGWHVGTESPSFVHLTRDSSVMHGGRASGRLEIDAGTATGVSGSASQVIRADAYRGQRVRLTGWLRTRDASAVVSWVRVEGAPRDTLAALALSSSEHRPAAGSAEWVRVDHVVDVAPAAGAIAFGVLLRGGGTVWLDDFALSPVDRTTPTTDRLGEPAAIREAPEEQRRIRASWATLAPGPLNLDFERPLASARSGRTP